MIFTEGQFADSAKGACVEFDIAARVRAMPRPLSFCYQALDDASWSDTKFFSVFPELSVGISLLSSDPYLGIISPRLNSDPDLPTVSRRFNVVLRKKSQRQRVFEPIFGVPQVFPLTLRWQYWVAAEKQSATPGFQWWTKS
jgi:hypothetical protein